MSAHQNTSGAKLKERLGYFFRSSARERTEVHEFAQGLLELGQVAVVGGMIRDLWLAGNRPFESDVDFVLDPDSLQQFERIMPLLGATRNRFGGYSVDLKQWKVEVWPLERTWAAVHGHVEVDKIEDIIHTTFFNWDGILYLIGEGRLVYLDGYFSEISKRHLEINLEANPNPAGNAIRALRYSCRWGGELGPRLAAHVSHCIVNLGWEQLLQAEARSFTTKYLPNVDEVRLLKAISAVSEKSTKNWVKVPLRDDHQMALFKN